MFFVIEKTTVLYGEAYFSEGRECSSSVFRESEDYAMNLLFGRDF